jgi:hypothetical protein
VATTAPVREGPGEAFKPAFEIHEGLKVRVVGSDDGHLYVLDVKDGKELWQYEVGAPIKISPAVAGDFIIVGADDGSLYAFKAAAPVPATPRPVSRSAATASLSSSAPPIHVRRCSSLT